MEDKEKKDMTPEDDFNNIFAEENKEEALKEEALADKVKIVSPTRLVLKRFFRSRLSVIGLVTLIVLFLFSFVGPLFSPWGETEADESVGAKKILDYPTNYAQKISSSENYVLMLGQLLNQLQALSAQGTITAEAYNAYVSDANSATAADESSTSADDSAKLKFMKSVNDALFGRVGTVVYGGEEIYYEIIISSVNTVYILEKTESESGSITYARVSTDIIQHTEDIPTRNMNASPSIKHWLGTDSSAYDIFTRLMYGGRISLTLGFVVMFIQVIIGIVLGGLAGFFGKWVDQIIMRIIDILNCLPSLPIMLIFSSILDGANVAQGIRIYLLMAMLAAIGWTGTARTVRGQILNLREMEFMVAAEAMGLSVPRRIFKHLVPNIMPLLIVQMTMGLGGIILTESTLSYLGLGIQHPQAAWGTMINSANDPRILEYYPNQWIPAGAMIILAVLAFNFVGDGLRDAFDPKMKR